MTLSLLCRSLFFTFFFLVSFTSLCAANNTDYWSINKTMKFPGEVAITSCKYFNKTNATSTDKNLINEFYVRWLEGWVSGFVMYADWDIRTIERREYIEWFNVYCSKFPENSLGMAAHAFAFRVKKENSVKTLEFAPKPMPKPTQQQQGKWDKVHEAYRGGKMTEKQRETYERFVESGEIPAPLISDETYQDQITDDIVPKMGISSIENEKTGNGAEGMYICTVNSSHRLSDEGVFSESALAKEAVGKQVVIDKRTGKMKGWTKNFNSFGSPIIVDSGSSEMAFKVITIFGEKKENLFVDYLEVLEYVKKDEKPFQYINSLFTISGLCLSFH